MEKNGRMVGQADQDRAVREGFDDGRVAGVIVEGVGDFPDFSLRIDFHDHGSRAYGVDVPALVEGAGAGIRQFDPLFEDEAAVRFRPEQLQGAGGAEAAAKEYVPVFAGGDA